MKAARLVIEFMLSQMEGCTSAFFKYRLSSHHLRHRLLFVSRRALGLATEARVFILRFLDCDLVAGGKRRPDARGKDARLPVGRAHHEGQRVGSIRREQARNGERDAGEALLYFLRYSGAFLALAALYGCCEKAKPIAWRCAAKPSLPFRLETP